MKKPSSNATSRKFAPGEIVFCPELRLNLEILEGPNAKGEYLSLKGSVRLWISSGRLQATEAPKKKARKQKSNSVPLVNRHKDSQDKMLRLDMHGFTVSQAVEQLEMALDKALHRDFRGLEVIHGIGSGALREAVHKYLSSSRHVSNFRLLEQNPGTTMVYL
ncbi:MAG: Smr/MutS family protein [Deltaproteobacteria bacterium]|nr:Smr/MutS family protein [Deltaproteobacteria bacterium]